MTKTEHDPEFAPLSGYFDAARRDAPDPSPELLARIMADARTVQAARGETARIAATGTGRRDPAWRRLLAGLGGWPALAGLSAATVAGLWVGLRPPEALEDRMVPLLELAGLETVQTDWLLDPSGADALGFDLTEEEGA